MSPMRHLQRQPMTIGFQSELQQPLRLLLLGRDDPDGLLVQSPMNHIGVNMRNEAILVVALRYFINNLI